MLQEFSEDSFLLELKKRRDFFEQELEESLIDLYKAEHPSLKEHKEALFYSILNSGKRFRPLLCLITAETIGVSPESVIPFACALEMVHNYSLVHDDLPSMDNDDFRRGKPTTHKKYNEATALLVGDSLLTDAFLLIANSYKNHPKVSQIVALLAQTSGTQGMIAGQVIDLWVQKNLDKINLNQDQLLEMHHLKTGQLIQSAVLGACLIGQLTEDLKLKYAEFSRLLGLAFQIKDDILDADEESFGLPAIIGLGQTKELLIDVNTKALKIIDSLHLQNSLLAEFIHYNEKRKN